LKQDSKGNLSKVVLECSKAQLVSKAFDLKIIIESLVNLLKENFTNDSKINDELNNIILQLYQGNNLNLMQGIVFIHSSPTS
jgi:hypothetical protein